MENTQLTTQVKESSFSLSTFEHSQRVAVMMAKSSLIPKEYVGRPENCMIALEMANRSGSSPLMVMQNLHVIQGKPSWSSPYIIAAINASGKFKSDLNFKSSGTGEDYGYEAYATKKTGEECISPKVTWKMVKAEGWLDKAGSKWKTMPELMFRYRSAAFFGRLFTPEILMGMQTVEEVVDIQPIEVITTKLDKELERMKLLIDNAQTPEELQALEPNVKEEQLDLFNEKMNQLKSK